jgi:hypothetical protein
MLHAPLLRVARRNVRGAAPNPGHRQHFHGDGRYFVSKTAQKPSGKYGTEMALVPLPMKQRSPRNRKRSATAPPAPSPLQGVGREAGFGALPEAETALMRAVLEDAILCYLGRGRRRRMDPRILAREAEFWIRRDDWESPFSFNNVCSALGLCADSARGKILSWKEEPQLAALALRYSEALH